VHQPKQAGHSEFLIRLASEIDITDVGWLRRMAKLQLTCFCASVLGGAGLPWKFFTPPPRNQGVPPGNLEGQPGCCQDPQTCVVRRSQGPGQGTAEGHWTHPGKELKCAAAVLCNNNTLTTYLFDVHASPIAEQGWQRHKFLCLHWVPELDSFRKDRRRYGIPYLSHLQSDHGNKSQEHTRHGAQGQGS
jgi:hypothetical protein